MSGAAWSGNLVVQLAALHQEDAASAMAQAFGEIERLRAKNRELNRRLSQNESVLHSRATLAEAHRDMWQGMREQSWGRMSRAFDEIRRIFSELRRVHDYPERAHSYNDMPASGRASGDGAVYANLYVHSVKDGIQTYRVLDEVRRTVDELLAARSQAWHAADLVQALEPFARAAEMADQAGGDFEERLVTAGSHVSLKQWRRAGEVLQMLRAQQGGRGSDPGFSALDMESAQNREHPSRSSQGSRRSTG